MMQSIWQSLTIFHVAAIVPLAVDLGEESDHSPAGSQRQNLPTSGTIVAGVELPRWRRGTLARPDFCHQAGRARVPILRKNLSKHCAAIRPVGGATGLLSGFA